MKSTLIMAIIAAIVAVLMLGLMVFDIMTANWPALSVCIMALLLNAFNAIRGFKRWRSERRFKDAFKTPRKLR